jgi:membrane fusion protein (multidrug efflux system)
MANANLKQSQIDLDYTDVKAPISGIAGVKLVDIGDLVSSAPSTALVTITQNDKVYLDFSMPMSDYKNIQKGLWSMPEDKKIGVTIAVVAFVPGAIQVIRQIKLIIYFPGFDYL